MVSNQLLFSTGSVFTTMSWGSAQPASISEPPPSTPAPTLLAAASPSSSRCSTHSRASFRHQSSRVERLTLCRTPRSDPNSAISPVQPVVKNKTVNTVTGHNAPSANQPLARYFVTSERTLLRRRFHLGAGAGHRELFLLAYSSKHARCRSIHAECFDLVTKVETHRNRNAYVSRLP